MRAQTLIDLANAATIGRARWQDFLDHARDLAPESCAMLIHYQTGRGAGRIALSAGLDEPARAAYTSFGDGANPVRPALGRRPVGEVFHTFDVTDRDSLRRSSIYAEFMRPRGIEAGFGAPLFREEADSYAFGLFTPALGGREREEVRARIAALVPHLRAAFGRIRSRPAAGEPFLPAAGGRIHLGAGGRVLSADETAEALLLEDATAAVLTIDGTGRLIARDPALAGMLEIALAGFDAPAPFARTLPLSRGEGALPLRVTVVRLAGGEAAFFRGPECILLLDDPGRDLAAAVEAFGKMHGLTCAERRVVLGLVRGRSVDAIAAEAGTARETVRRQLKQVYLRSGLGGQLDVVRHVCLIAGGCADAG